MCRFSPEINVFSRYDLLFHGVRRIFFRWYSAKNAGTLWYYRVDLNRKIERVSIVSISNITSFW